MSTLQLAEAVSTILWHPAPRTCQLTFRLYTMSEVKAPRTLSVAHSCRLFMQR